MKALSGRCSKRGRRLSAAVLGSALLLGALPANADEPLAPAEGALPEKAPAPVLAGAPKLSPPVFSIGAASPVDAVEPRYRYPGLRIAGIVVTSVGLATAVAGGSLLLAGKVAADNCNTAEEDMCGLGETVVGIVTLIASGPIIVTGAPMWIVGSLPPKAPASAWMPTNVAVGPGSATLQWSF